jgi:hypothetical protein
MTNTSLQVVVGYDFYVPPHRYCYEDHRVDLRPDEWPLY